MNSDKLDAALGEFFAESDEILQRMSSNLSRLEQGEYTHETLDDLYRDMHTTKGSAQLFGLSGIASVAHTMETCLDPVRKTLSPPNSALLDSLFECLRVMENLLNMTRAGQTLDLDEKSKRALALLIEKACHQFGQEFSLLNDPVVPQDDLKWRPQKPTAAEPDGKESKLKLVVKEDVERTVETTIPTEHVIEPLMDTTIRVQVGLLDTLMNLVGEMVLVRNQVLQHSSRSEDLEFLNLSQRLDVVTSELQDQVMKTRMQPIGNVLGKFQRLVRDLAKDLGKKIDLTLQGKETELDKTLLEAIKDPLTHIVRNSCDHGIENPLDRVGRGKPETGHILIRSYHEGGQVIVEISDDGGGLNRQKIVDKAIERNILTSEAAERMTDREKMNLIFHPGLSTAKSVSTVSGRGVGMDVVKTNIERIGGSVELDSIEGKGSTVRLRIPLTLAIVPAMLVRSGSDQYAIPQIKLVELVRIEGEGSDLEAKALRFVQGRPVYELRGKLLPLVDLHEVLSGHQNQVQSESSSERKTINIVVLNAEGDMFGLIVDEVLDTADIVVKPLSKFLKTLEVFSAATILGSGRVSLILDPSGIAKTAELTVEKRVSDSDFHSSSSISGVNDSDSQDYLLFSLGLQGRFAIPLCMVSRLEEFNRTQVEFSGKQTVIRYRDSILPLINVDDVLMIGDQGPSESDMISTIVVQRGGRAFGLIVNDILDVTTIDSPIDDSVKDRFGVLGNLIANNEIIVVIDALSIIEKETARFGITSSNPAELILPEMTSQGKIRVLYAEDVAFFRRQVSKLLNANGFEVIAVEDGKAALEAYQAAASKPFRLILSDIEMPRMNGFDLARAIRRLAKGGDIPMVALTTRFKQRDIDEGIQAGFNGYLEKLNQETLLTKLAEVLKKSASSPKETAI